MFASFCSKRVVFLRSNGHWNKILCKIFPLLGGRRCEHWIQCEQNKKSVCDFCYNFDVPGCKTDHAYLRHPAPHPLHRRHRHPLCFLVSYQVMKMWLGGMSIFNNHSQDKCRRRTRSRSGESPGWPAQSRQTPCHECSHINKHLSVSAFFLA